MKIRGYFILMLAAGVMCFSWPAFGESKKISELTDLGAAPANDDEMVIVDTSETETKKVSIADLFTSPPITSLGAPAAAGEAIRQTTTVTESNLNQLTDGSDTTLHDHDGISENTAARHTQNTDTGTSNNFTVADGKYLATDKVRAYDGAGLYLVDDGDNGIFVEDGGQAGINTATPGARLDIVPASSSEVVLRAKSLQSTAPLGSELVTDGGFASDLSNWTSTNWTWNAGTALHTTTHTDALSQSISVTDGQVYQVSLTISGRTAGTVTFNVGGVYIYNYGAVTTLTASTIKSFVASGTGSQTLAITPTADFDGAIDDVSVKQITGGRQAAATFLDDDGAVAVEIAGDSGLYNSFLGNGAGYSNTTGTSNTFSGNEAGYSNTTGDNNTFSGYWAGYSNTTGYNNTFSGYWAGYSNTTGFNNTFTGYAAGRYIANGSTANTTSDYCVLIGQETKVEADNDQNEIVIGYNATGNGSNTVTLGNTSITELHCQVALTVDSDRRVKKDIADNVIGLDFLNKLKPVTFKKLNPADYPEEIKPPEYKQRVVKEKEIDENGKETQKEIDVTIEPDPRPEDNPKTYTGLIAQDVEKALTESGLDISLVTTSGQGRKGITYENLIPVLITAVQELAAKVTKLESDMMAK